jgi:hypothetical protein
MLLRQFIRNALYQSPKSYFESAQTLTKLQPIEFRNLLNQDAYTKAVAERYAQGGWTTPSDLFYPMYGQCVAEHILKATQKMKSCQNVAIVEIGAGNGSLAESILQSPALNNTRGNGMGISTIDYHIVEISSMLHSRQKQRLSGNKHIILHQADASSWKPAAPGKQSKQYDGVVLVMMEVLDNVPNDGVRPKKSHSGWEEAHVDPRSGVPALKFEPVSDPWIQYTLPYYEHLGRGLSSSFTSFFSKLADPGAADLLYVPSGAAALFWNVFQQLSTWTKGPLWGIVADFDAFPYPMPGILGPVIQSKKLSKNVEVQSWDELRDKMNLLGPEEACQWDIMFPTDFEATSHMIHDMLQNVGYNQYASDIQQHGSFFGQFGPSQLAQTQSGYNPLLQDYRNMQVLSWEANRT